MARRILNRKELRADYDAAEQRTKGETEDQEEEELEDEDQDAEEDGEAEEGASEADEVEEEQPVVKKRKAPKATKAKPRTRAQKVTRMKVVWGVFNNSNQRVAVFEYPKRQDAQDLAAKLTSDKKNTHFVQPVKEPIEEK